VGENYALSGTLKDNGVMGVFDWSPDSRYVAYAAHERVAQVEELFLVPANGEGSHRISGSARAGTGVDSVSFSPDSQFVAYVANHQTPSAFQVFVSNLAGDQNVLVGTAQRGAVWSRDSAYLAVRQDTDSSVVVFDSAAFQTFPLADRLPAELQVSKTEKLDFAVSRASR
jgi:Tol biopolymer transport system component